MLEKLSYLTNKLSNIPEISAIILYGSYARGEAGKKSDIDILIITENKEKIEDIEEKVFEIIEEDSLKRVVPIVISAEDLRNSPYYIFDILRDGIVLYKSANSLLEIPLALPEKSMTLYQFDLSHLKQSEKVKVNRALYGSCHYRKLQNGKKKQYIYNGIVDEIKGEKLGSGAILVPSKADDLIEKILKYQSDASLNYKKMHLIMVEKILC